MCDEGRSKGAQRSQFRMRNLLLRKVIIICLPTLPIYEKFPTYERILIYLGTYLIPHTLTFTFSLTLRLHYLHYINQSESSTFLSAKSIRPFDLVPSTSF